MFFLKKYMNFILSTSYFYYRCIDIVAACSAYSSNVWWSVYPEITRQVLSLIFAQVIFFIKNGANTSAYYSVSYNYEKLYYIGTGHGKIIRTCIYYFDHIIRAVMSNNYTIYKFFKYEIFVQYLQIFLLS